MKGTVEAAAEMAGALTQALAGFDPWRLSGSEAVELVEVLAGVEKVCAATRAGQPPGSRTAAPGGAGGMPRGPGLLFGPDPP